MTQNTSPKSKPDDESDKLKLLRTLIDALPDCIYIKDNQGRYVFTNVAHVRRLGATNLEEVVGKTNSNFEPKEHAERYDADEQEILSSGQPLIGKEEPCLDEKGNERWNSTSKVPLREGSSEIVGLAGVTRDITEHKWAQEALRKSEENLAEAQRMAHLGSWEWDTQTGEVLWSDEVFRIYGYEPQEFVPTLDKLMEVVHPDDQELVERRLRASLRENEPYDFEHRIVRSDGEVRVVHRRAEVVFDEEGEPLRMLGTVHDITERKEAEEALRESEERFRTAFEDAPIGVALVGLDRSHLRVNRAYCQMLGYTEEELLAKPHSEIIHPEDREESTHRIEGILGEETEPYAIERRYFHADGRVVWSLSNLSLVRDAEGKPSHFVCLHEDITERKELEEQLRHQAFYDSLTDLPNRSLLLDRLDHALARAGREGGQVVVLLLDLDDFKAVNDSLGHDAGNAVLIEVTLRLRACMRPGDTVARIFGDEFAVLLGTPAGEEEAERVARRIEERLREPFEVAGQEVFVKASIGIALGETADDNPDRVLQRADLAMYEAKRNGKAQHETYNPSMTQRVVERTNLERDLRRAIKREEFEVHYQPKVLLETGAIVGVEALVRWRHPDRGLLLPAQFIQLAEETGLIDKIGLWILKESCRQVMEWQEQHPAKLDLPFALCVNLSAKEIQASDLAEKLAGILHETGLDPGRLVLEISERTAMEDAEQTIGRLRELKDLGVKLAIDDFGTGYCSLVYLEHSLLDILKIDRVLIHREREDQEECATIISAMTSMAHSLGLTVTVEGVEEEWQVAKLKEIGCEMAQGYYFAKPLPSEAVETLFLEGISC